MIVMDVYRISIVLIIAYNDNWSVHNTHSLKRLSNSMLKFTKLRGFHFNVNLAVQSIIDDLVISLSFTQQFYSIS